MTTQEPEQVDRFIELRSQGWTFARIAAELAVSKPTLVAWSRKHQHRIQKVYSNRDAPFRLFLKHF